MAEVWPPRSSVTVVASIREIVTWTQLGNEAMQHVNAGLGYTTRSISRTMHRDLP